MHLDRSRYLLEFDEDFTGTEFDRTRWLPHYLPHWAGLEVSRARYALDGSVLSLRIDADQPVWHPEVAPGMRVSNLQTGHRSGQHRTDERLTVRHSLPESALYISEMAPRW